MRYGDHEYEPDEATALVLGPDWYLMALLETANSGTVFEFTVTLLVGGRELRGNIISGRKYFELVAEQAQHTGASEVFKVAGRIAYPADSEIEAGVAKPPTQSDIFLHLHSVDGLLYRIRAACVDGWAVGYISDL